MTGSTGRILALIEARVKGLISELHLNELYHFKGTVNDVASLPLVGNKVGDVYNIGASLDGDNYAWTGSAWDKLGGTIGLVTQDSPGLMSAADKAKLDGIASGANAYVYAAYSAVNTSSAAELVDMSALCDGGIMIVTIDD